MSVRLGLAIRNAMSPLRALAVIEGEAIRS
jgi:hypothetical protein